MLDAVIEFMPSPVDIADVKGTDDDEVEVSRKADDNGKVLCIGIQTDD
jgi:elongation factor G